MKRRTKKTRGGSKPHRGEPATMTLRVRMTPKEHEELFDVAYEHSDTSEYVRTALRRYREVYFLMRFLEGDQEKRALSTFECNVLATVNPESYLEMGGAELTKPPRERARESEPPLKRVRASPTGRPPTPKA
jgi:hypothetical protein